MPDSNIARRRALARRESNPAYLEKRAQIVAAAAALFKRKGFEATTLNDIAEVLGTDRASVYYYVASKHELLQEVVADATRDHLRVAAELKASDLNSGEKVHRLMVQIMQSYDAHYPSLYVYLQEDMGTIARKGGPWAREMVQQTRAFENALVDLLREGVESGEFRSDLNLEYVGKAFWGMLNWSHTWHKPRGSKHVTAIADTFAELFLKGLSAS